MSFEAYITNIHAKTGKMPEDFHAIAAEKGLTGPHIKASQIVDWLKADFGLGHGHAQAIWAVFKRNGWTGEG